MEDSHFQQEICRYGISNLELHNKRLDEMALRKVAPFDYFLEDGKTCYILIPLFFFFGVKNNL